MPREPVASSLLPTATSMSAGLLLRPRSLPFVLPETSPPPGSAPPATARDLPRLPSSTRPTSRSTGPGVSGVSSPSLLGQPEDAETGRAPPEGSGSFGTRAKGGSPPAGGWTATLNASLLSRRWRARFFASLRRDSKSAPPNCCGTFSFPHAAPPAARLRGRRAPSRGWAASAHSSAEGKRRGRWGSSLAGRTSCGALGSFGSRNSDLCTRGSSCCGSLGSRDSGRRTRESSLALRAGAGWAFLRGRASLLRGGGSLERRAGTGGRRRPALGAGAPGGKSPPFMQPAAWAPCATRDGALQLLSWMRPSVSSFSW